MCAPCLALLLILLVFFREKQTSRPLGGLAGEDMPFLDPVVYRRETGFEPATFSLQNDVLDRGVGKVVLEYRDLLPTQSQRCHGSTEMVEIVFFS